MFQHNFVWLEKVLIFKQICKIWDPDLEGFQNLKFAYPLMIRAPTNQGAKIESFYNFARTER